MAGAQTAPPTDLILVGLDPRVSEAEAEAQFAAQGLAVVRWWRWFDLAAVRPVEARSASAALAQVQAMPIVRFAEADGPIEAAALGDDYTPDDPVYPQQWALHQIGMPAAWSLAQGDPSLVVAVLDSGVEVGHEDLGERIYATNPAEAAGEAGVDDDGNGYVDDIHGWDWIEGDNEPNDAYGHGTHVAGTLAAATDNGLGIAGMAAGLRILPLRVLDSRGSGAISDLVSALDYAGHYGVKIVNLSLVLRFDSSAVGQAVARLHAAGVLVVAATGNFGSQVYWPAAYTTTLAVAAVDAGDGHASFSNPGPETDVAAPGDNVLSTYLHNSYFSSRGTSMATPHVAALAALIWGLRPDWDREAVVEAILSTAVDANAADFPGHDPYLGHGRIDAAAALTTAAAAVDVIVSVPGGVYLGPGQPLQIPVRLRVPGPAGRRLPVAGGVVEAELTGPGGDVYDTSGRRLSDAEGYALLDLTLPDAGGRYTLTVRGAGQTASLALDVQESPLQIVVQSSAAEMVVGEGSVDVYVAAYTAGGERYTDPLQVTVQTSLGAFAGGERTYTTLMQGGELTTTLYAGETAGEAHLSVDIANQTHQHIVLIRAGVPYRLEGPDPIYGLNFGRGAVVELRLRLYDRYGNPVTSSHMVNFYSLGGRFSPPSPRAVDGEVTTEYTINAWETGSLRIWAMVPGTFALYRAEARLLSAHHFLPLMRREE